ncbi:MAG: trypsin-like peptidase domain-containing protein [Acidobacteriota bacterium]
MKITSGRVMMSAALLVVAGFLVGLVVSGRLDLTAPSVAAVDDTQPAAAAAAADVAVPAMQPAGLPDLSAIAERALDVSVNISSTSLVRVPVDPFFAPFFGNRVQRSQSLGSGVIVSPDGYILTNTHVVGNQPETLRVTLGDGQERPARLIGTDQISDLAVIKIDETGLPTIPWGDSSKLRVAEWVLAVGNPFQLSGTVTLGIVSTVSRAVGAYQDFIQTDAAINPGNSGGALINARGELVGINTMIYSETGGYQGIGFAIPSNTARQIMAELIEHGYVTWGSIGRMTLVGIDANRAQRYGLPSTGAWVQSIARSASAYRAGLEPGDLITAINGQSIASVEDLDRVIVRQKVGSTVTLSVIKEDGRRVELRVPVEPRRSEPR